MKSWLFACVFSLLGAAAVADDRAPYTIEAKARQVRADDQPGSPADRRDIISVETRIAENRKDGAVLSAPRLSLFDGSQAQIAVGDRDAKAQPDPAAGAKDSHAGAITSGLKIDVIKPLGVPKVLVVTTILKEGKVIWADAQWSKIDPAKP